VTKQSLLRDAASLVDDVVEDVAEALGWLLLDVVANIPAAVGKDIIDTESKKGLLP